MPITIEQIEKHVSRDTNKLSFPFGFKLSVPSDVVEVCKYLDAHPEITALSVMTSELGCEAAVLFAQTKTLTELSLNGCGIADKGAIALAQNSTIKYLDVGVNRITDVGVIALAENSTILKLSLSFNKFGIPGAKALASNTTIRELQIINCEILGEGAIALAANTTISKLDMKFCKFGPDKIKVARAFRSNNTIRSLCFSFDEIGREGAEIMWGNLYLRNLDVGGVFTLLPPGWYANQAPKGARKVPSLQSLAFFAVKREGAKPDGEEFHGDVAKVAGNLNFR